MVGNNVAPMMVVICLLLGSQFLMEGVVVQANVALVEEEFCLDHCIKNCKSTGISPLRCFKYCEKHCKPPAKLSPGWHYCKLGCIIDQCAKFHKDEGKQEGCMANCEKNVCLTG